MRLVRLAIANINSTVGAVRSNADRGIAWIERAAADGASLVALPEEHIGGYPPEDLVQWGAFVESQWTALMHMAEATRDLGIAFATGLVVARGSHVYNCAALVQGGRVHGIVPKEKLPLYNVFYEARTFARGVPGMVDEVRGVPFGDLIFELDFGTVALEVCEDGWSPDGPMRRRCYAGAEVVVNLSASPFRLGVLSTRREMLATRASDNQATVVYANLVGANDGLIFDGGGFVAQNGRILLEGARFQEGLCAVTVDLDRTKRLRIENSTWRSDQETWASTTPAVKRVKVPGKTPDRSSLRFPFPPNRSFFIPNEDTSPPRRSVFCDEILDALALGIGDYMEKTGVFRCIGVALSGGRDSLLVAILARRWIERKYADLPRDERKAKARQMLRLFFMPTRFSSGATKHAAEVAARDLDATFECVSIEDAFARELSAIEAMLGPGESMTALARQNVQARIRAERMWTWANAAGGFFLQTSNMSEKAVGYATIGGDTEGALSVIANLPKTLVNYLLDYLLETTEQEGIRLTLEKPASAELADDQEDERDLMPFPILDASFYLFAGEKMSIPEVTQAVRDMFPEYSPENIGAWVQKFARLFAASIYKWVQAPVSLHVGNLDLERERALQLPVVSRAEW